jgi:hypothetical protein
MIDIANGCAKRTGTSDFRHNRCVNHHYFLICTQGKSEGLGSSSLREEQEYGQMCPLSQDPQAEGEQLTPSLTGDEEPHEHFG